MKLLNNEIEKRVYITLDRSINSDKTSGIMKFGVQNDYPQVIEKLIGGSQTAKACSDILAKFIAGMGFKDPKLGATVVGKDATGKPITLDKIRRSAANQVAKYKGYYLHSNFNREGGMANTRPLNFKNCRLSRIDDKGYSSEIAYHENWSKDRDLKSFRKSDVVWFPMFNPKFAKSQIEKNGLEGYNGQAYHAYFDNDYSYPLSTFDPVFLEMDSENQMQIYRNRQLRNGSAKKLILNIGSVEDEETMEKIVDKAKSWSGPDGENILIFETEFDDNGNIQETQYKLDIVDSNIDAKAFEGYSEESSNNIRKSANGMPAVLIDYEQGTLSQASGEMLTQAVNVYNAYTKDLQDAFEDSLKDFFKYFPGLEEKDFTILPLQLTESEVTNDNP